jgi:hypothetical protein
VAWGCDMQRLSKWRLCSVRRMRVSPLREPLRSPYGLVHAVCRVLTWVWWAAGVSGDMFARALANVGPWAREQKASDNAVRVTDVGGRSSPSSAVAK